MCSFETREDLQGSYKNLAESDPLLFARFFDCKGGKRSREPGILLILDDFSSVPMLDGMV